MLQNVDRPPMAIEQRTEVCSDHRQLDDLGQWALRQFRNQARGQAKLRRCFYDQRQLCRRLRQFYRRFGRGELRAVNDVPPMNEVGQRLYVKTELAAGGVRKKLRA